MTPTERANSTNSLFNSYEFYFGPRKPLDNANANHHVSRKDNAMTYADVTDDFKTRRARAAGSLNVYVRAALDAHENGYEASPSVWTELRRLSDEYEAVNEAMIAHILERTTP